MMHVTHHHVKPLLQTGQQWSCQICVHNLDIGDLQGNAVYQGVVGTGDEDCISMLTAFRPHSGIHEVSWSLEMLDKGGGKGRDLHPSLWQLASPQESCCRGQIITMLQGAYVVCRQSCLCRLASLWVQIYSCAQS